MFSLEGLCPYTVGRPTRELSLCLADPPWHYNGGRNKSHRFRGGARQYYPVLKTEQICQMTPWGIPVADLFAENAALFLWGTWPNLPEIFPVLKAWGFKFKTLGFLWVKTNRNNGEPFFGTGFYCKSNSEPCHLALRGRLKPITNSISQVFEEPMEVEDDPTADCGLVVAPRGEHSAKPPSIADKIVELFGDLPRLELFCRPNNGIADGWHKWGKAVDPAHEFDVPGNAHYTKDPRALAYNGVGKAL